MKRLFIKTIISCLLLNTISQSQSISSLHTNKNDILANKYSTIVKYLEWSINKGSIKQIEHLFDVRLKNDIANQLVKSSISDKNKTSQHTHVNILLVGLNMSNDDYVFIDVKYQVYYCDKVIREGQTKITVKIKRTEIKITDLGNLLELLSINFKESNNKQNVESSYNDVQIQLSDKTLIAYPHYGDIYELTSSTAQQYLQKQLIALGSDAEMDIFDFGKNAVGEVDRAVFVLDPTWKRILYARIKYDNCDYIRAFYGSPGRFFFDNPVAIDVNSYGEIFIADAGASRIYKLLYDAYNEVVYLGPDYIFIDSDQISSPLDIHYETGSTGDYIVAIDGNSNSIKKFNSNGQLVGEYATYHVNGTEAPIISPKRLVANSDYLAFIDSQENLIVSAAMITDNFLDCMWGKPSKLPLGSLPHNIGWYSGLNLAVSDPNMDMIHKFNLYGEYVCSYNGSMDVNNSIFSSIITIPTTYKSSLGLEWLSFYTYESYSSSSGLRRFLPGADALNLSVED